MGILNIDGIGVGLEAQCAQTIITILGDTLANTRVGTGVDIGVTLALTLQSTDDIEIVPGVSAHPPPVESSWQFSADRAYNLTVV